MEHTIPDDTSVTVAVVQATSELEGRDPIALPPLGNVVDPDALNRLFGAAADENGRAVGSVSFEYSDSHVTVSNDQRVVVELRLPT